MDGGNNEKIVGYFIEEAKEHLETIEKGILDLSSVIDDEESVNELFRAAHSIKGGAAMLGFTSIQTTAHRLEDAFKIIKDQTIKPDQTLESLFLKAYDILQDLLERLQGPFGLKEEEGESIIQAASPHFTELQNYLQQLVDGDIPTAPKITSAQVKNSAQSLSSIPVNEIVMEIRPLLQRMLAIFKQESTTENRQQLQGLCDRLVALAPEENGWQNLLKCCQKAIGNPKHSYRLLAPVVIKEIKLAGDCLEVGKGAEIAPSQGLEQLAQAKTPQILLSLDPETAATTLTQVFNRDQLSKLVRLLQATG
ncbi:MAG: Hpt domain-containing protein [Cyanobacterium sp. T60_A2020_053]|nr:Hpt domain-containing protein [Cyanobacterium sp. T60_A2020_053]